MKFLSLRRTKTMIIDGKPILELPLKTETVVFVTLSTAERLYYDMIHNRAKAYFLHLEETDLISKNYATLLSTILRMRQAATHRRLIKYEEWIEKLSIEDVNNIEPMSLKTAVDLLMLLKEAELDICSVCGSTAEIEKVVHVTTCKHLYSHH